MDNFHAVYVRDRLNEIELQFNQISLIVVYFGLQNDWTIGSLLLTNSTAKFDLDAQ